MLLRLAMMLCDVLGRVFAPAIVVILASILAINTLEIVSRSFFDVSFQWIYETNLLLASWMYFLGIFLVYRRSGDITVVGLRSALPGRWRSAFDRGVHALTGAVFLLAAWYGWKLVELQWPFRTPGVGFPRAAFTVPLLVGLVAVALQVLTRAAAGAGPDDRHGGAQGGP